MPTPRDGSIDNARRDDLRAGLFDVVEVIEVFPHVNTYESGDKDFNSCTVRLISRWSEEDAKLLRRVRLMPLQRNHGLFQGDTWNPRIGDNVLIAWLNGQEAVVMGSIASYQQEPVCRSEATRYDQERVYKRSPWEEPREMESAKAKDFERQADGSWKETLRKFRNYLWFPKPKNPDCHKWWPLTRDSIFIHDCPNGHAHPECNKDTPCTCLDDIQCGTWLKIFSSISPTMVDLVRRVKFHHHCGSVFFFDDDGVIHLENKTSEGYPACTATRKGQIHFEPTGTIWMRSEPETSDAAMVRVVSKEDQDSIRVEMVDETTDAYVRIMKNGEVMIYSPVKITLDAPLVHVTQDHQIDGFCAHGPCSCP